MSELKTLEICFGWVCLAYWHGAASTSDTFQSFSHPYPVSATLSRKMTGGGAETSSFTKGSEGHMHPCKYAREPWEGEGIKTLRFCWIQTPKSPSYLFALWRQSQMQLTGSDQGFQWERKVNADWWVGPHKPIQCFVVGTVIFTSIIGTDKLYACTFTSH